MKTKIRCPPHCGATRHEFRSRRSIRRCITPRCGESVRLENQEKLAGAGGGARRSLELPRSLCSRYASGCGFPAVRKTLRGTRHHRPRLISPRCWRPLRRPWPVFHPRLRRRYPHGCHPPRRSSIRRILHPSTPNTSHETHTSNPSFRFLASTECGASPLLARRSVCRCVLLAGIDHAGTRSDRYDSDTAGRFSKSYGKVAATL